jgi:hypothetical protein
MDRPCRRQHHSIGSRQRRDPIFRRVSRVFYVQLSIFALECRHMPERATDPRVELEHQQLHGDDPNQGEGQQSDPQAPPDQPVQEGAARDALERVDATQRYAR